MKPAGARFILRLMLGLCLSAGAQAARADAGSSPGTPSGPLLTLEDAYRLALERNERVKISDEDVLASNETIREARAGILPTLSASVTQSLNKEYGSGAFASFRTNRDVAIQLSQAIWGGGKEWAALRAARVQKELSGLQSRLARQSVLLDVAAQYLAAVRAEKQMTIARKSLDLSREQLALARARKEAGSATRTEVIRSEVAVSAAERDVLRAENAVEVFRARLAFVVGRPVTERIADVTDAVPAPDATDPDAVDATVRQALRERADYRAARLTGKLAEEYIVVRRASFFPSVRAGGTYTQTQRVNTIREHDNWQMQASVSYDLFDGFERDAGYEKAKIQLRQTALEQMHLARQVELDVREALLAIHLAQAIRQTAEGEVTAARENYERVFEQFREGLSTAVDVADAHTMLIAAEVEQTTAETEISMARRKLEWAGGSLGTRLLQPVAYSYMEEKDK